jgi:probable F420-dependent oxidoreductase
MDHLIQIPPVGAPDEPFIEGWTALSALAAVTSRIRLATLASSVAYRNPAHLAKIAAGVDLISRGRLTLGIGAGWFETEYRQYGWEFPERPAVRIRQLEEAVRLILAMWTERRTTFQGKYFHARDAILEPKPVQKPHPPVILGGAFPWAARRAIRYGDGWYPNAASGEPEDYVPAFRKMAQEAGREPKSLSLRLGGAPDDGDKLKRFRDMGVDAVNVTLNPDTRDKLLPVLDHWAGHIRQLHG